MTPSHHSVTNRERSSVSFVAVLLALICLIGLFFAFIEETHAQVYEQTDTSIQHEINTSFPQHTTVQEIRNVSGFIEEVGIYASRSGFGVVELGFKIDVCSVPQDPLLPTETITGICAGSWSTIVSDVSAFSIPGNTTPTLYSWVNTSTTTIELESDKLYLFYITENSSSGSAYVHGAPLTDSYLGESFDTNSCASSCTSNDFTQAYRIQTDSPEPPNPETPNPLFQQHAEIWNYEPEYLSVEPSTTVTTSFDYYFNSSLFVGDSFACSELRSLEQMSFAPDSIGWRTLCEPILASGTSTFSTTTTLSEGVFSGVAYIQNQGQRFYVTETQFTVIAPLGVVVIPPAGGSASSTGSFLEICYAPSSSESTSLFDWTIQKFVEALRMPICWLVDGFVSTFRFFFYPSPDAVNSLTSIEFTGRAPFSYLVQTPALVTSIYAPTDPAEMGVTVEIFGSEFDIFTASQVVPFQPVLTVVRTFLIFALWIATIWAIWRTTLGMHDNSNQS